MALDPLGVIFMAKDLASSQIKTLEANFKSLDSVTDTTAKKFSKNVGVMTAGLTAMAAGFAIAAPVALGIKNAIHYQSALVKLGNIADVTGATLNALGDDVRKLSAEFDFDPTSVLEAMAEIASGGFSARESLALVDKVLMFQGASQGALTVETAAATMNAALKGFGFHVKDAQFVVDQLTQATNVTALKFDELAYVLGVTAADANLTNQEFANTLSMLGALRDTGLTAMRAGEKFRIALQHLIDPKAAKMAQKLGLSLRDSNGQMRQLVDISTDLIPKLEQLPQVQKEQALAALFGKEAMSVYNAAAKATFTVIENGTEKVLHGTAALKAMALNIRESAGTTRKQFENFKATFEGAWAAIKANVSAGFLELGLPFLEFVTRITTGLQSITKAASTFLANNPKIAKMVSLTLLLVGGFVAVVGAIVAAKAAMALLTLAVGPLTVFFGGLLVVFAKVALVVGAIIAAFMLLRLAIVNNFAGIGDFFTDLWGRVSGFFQAIFGLIFNGEISEELNAELERLGIAEFVDSFMRIFVKVRKALTSFFQGFAAGFKTALPGLSALAKGFMFLLSSIGNLIVAVVGFFDKMLGGSEANEAALGGIEAVFKTIGFILGSAAGIVTTFYTSIAGLVEFLGGGLVWVITKIVELGGALVSYISIPMNALYSMWQKLAALITPLLDKIANSAIVKGIFGKLSAELFPAAGTTGAPAAAPQVMPAGSGVLAPTAGYNNANLATQANVNATQAGMAGLGDILGKQEKSPGEFVLRNQVVLDGKVVADSVNKVNSRERRAAGGQR